MKYNNFGEFNKEKKSVVLKPNNGFKKANKI